MWYRWLCTCWYKKPKKYVEKFKTTKMDPWYWKQKRMDRLEREIRCLNYISIQER